MSQYVYVICALQAALLSASYFDSLLNTLDKQYEREEGDKRDICPLLWCVNERRASFVIVKP